MVVAEAVMGDGGLRRARVEERDAVEQRLLLGMGMAVLMALVAAVLVLYR